MGDSTAMTIEFLRARLLSERSVSRAARQRADQLAARVMELEEQLRVVTVQRKKAEKAAAEVLTILETQGISDLSEAIDSSSDGEVPCDDTLKEYESSIASRVGKSEVEDGLSGTEPEVSPSQGKSLSWKSHSKSPDSHDKQREKQTRQRQRRRNFVTTLQSSSKHQLGKSCRKIKCKDGGSTADNGTDKPTVLDPQGNRGASHSKYCDDQPEVSVEAPRGLMEAAVADISDSHHRDGDHNRQTEGHPCGNGSGRDEDMERVLEKRAMLIYQFQAEENAQREWEQKYNEKTISNLADNEAGNLIAENNSQSKEELCEPADGVSGYNGEATLRAAHTSNNDEAMVGSLSSSDKNDVSDEASNIASSNGSMHRDTTAAYSGNYSDVQENNSVLQNFDLMAARKTNHVSQKFTDLSPNHHSMFGNAKKQEVIPHDGSNGYPSNARLHSRGRRTVEGVSAKTSFLVDDHRKLPKLRPQQKNQVQRQGHQSGIPSSSLGGVLEALQRAKLSLTQELTKMPSQGTLAVAAPTNSPMRASGPIGGLDIPMGSASLFRLPTDSIPPAQSSGVKLYDSGLTFPTYRPDIGSSPGAYGYQNPAAPLYVNGGSRAVMHREYNMDNQFGAAMGARGSHAHSRASSDLLAERTQFRRESSKSYSDSRNYRLYGSEQTSSERRML